ncbi:MAG: transposase [Verrucomicrobiales bacterium]|nr:transposase [Verrucomicrobiales bacterium]
MPRAPRIEYENATYHVMARGNRRMDIVSDDGDRKLFLETLGEACEMSGWEVFAWVLMSNHYHIVFRTPEPNLVAGMTWFQNAFTRRINTKNRLWGRLFGDRYKAVLVDSETASFPGSEAGRFQACYLATLIDYVHLNPARAGMVPETGNEPGELRDYEWSSFSQGYVVAPSKRPAWLVVKEGLEVLGYSDTVGERRAYARRLEDWSKEGEQESGANQGALQPSLQSTLRRGWFWGSEQFKETLIERFGAAHREEGEHALSPTSRRSEQARDFSLAEAERIVREGIAALGLNESDVERPKRGDLRRAAIGWVVWHQTSGVPHRWIAEKLGFRTAANSSQQIRNFGKIPQKELPGEIRKWIRGVSVRK